jgi:hypothetical protein
MAVASHDLLVWRREPRLSQTFAMRRRNAACTVAAAFADEREASYAVRLIGASPEIKARFTLRNVMSERGDVAMVVLEVALADAAHASRVETCMAGAHGAVIPNEVLERAALAS